MIKIKEYAIDPSPFDQILVVIKELRRNQPDSEGFTQILIEKGDT